MILTNSSMLFKLSYNYSSELEVGGGAIFYHKIEKTCIFMFINGSFTPLTRLGVWRTSVILHLGGQYLGWFEEGGSTYS